MVQVRLPGVNRVKRRLASGAVRIHHYHRATGTPLPGRPGSPEFLAAHAAAEKSTRDRLKGTVDGLMRAYTLSPEFAELAPRTQAEYRRMLTRVETQFGTMPLAALEDPRVRQDFLAWRNAIRATSGPREADHRLSVVSAMLSWAIQAGQIHNNHVAGFKRLHHADRAELIWEPHHIEAFMNAAPIELQRALILALHTGQRQGDLLALTWNNYANGKITLRQNKTRAPVTFPATQTLRQMLEAIPRTDSLVILTTKGNRPWKPRYFKSQWQAATARAGIQDLHFHDLRGTAITLLAEAGCTIPQIASITGHSLKTASQILDRYQARTHQLAGAAITRFEAATTSNFANQLRAKGK